MRKILIAVVISAGAAFSGAAGAAPVHAPLTNGIDRTVAGGQIELVRDRGHHRGWNKRHHGWRRGHHYGWRHHRFNRRHWRPYWRRHHWRHRHWR
ncbi:MAG: twin-arginine translocation (Tat) [Rhodoblastus sp.]|nr:twin-arginine translocation (Tat) [Rhodoblastus sp.]MCC2101922.1 twin-arginine translocation (Tat) [Hyphomicrobiales bacterium]MCO5089160.1 twin-arginine translocation (Tat) [Methylobacteriaceae bacterium]HPG04529.1 twin-arginine translocation (Tat) [Rhodoblastus sp.]